ncbi:SRPBCC family protein [Usitatibacter palustris]|uniref:SRPBCC family protein n=1 Tax=Usitatibacter palustris TaxID=2732487 RepID=A0A6M4HDF4_9PROT|nr:SRPBCC family protein [Usitatibacter palustris]QJR16017.1 hypothetical protein DSM104440_02845 [Usitatibacter palustris]
MNVINVHERDLRADPHDVGALIDTLASANDRLWPHEDWPRMKFDRPLAVGARGGHGPIRYFVEAYAPGSFIRFRFTGPRGLEGTHGLYVLPGPQGTIRLRHSLEITPRGLARFSWPLAYRWLHDALVEDALTKAEAALGLAPRRQAWSPYVRFLRWLAARGVLRLRIPRAGPA